MATRKRELILDFFAGGGGWSTGARAAYRREVDKAVNHDFFALAMHRMNHPGTEHFQEDVYAIDPMVMTKGQAVGHAHFSPDCTYFSKARGKKPIREKGKKIRGLAWVIFKWTEAPLPVRPRVITLENVEEFEDMGPLLEDETRCPLRKGATFKSFVKRLIGDGYVVEWRVLRACDYGAPTIRKRLFLIARRDGKPIVWPEPTHGDPVSEAVRTGRLKPWQTAAECIDFTLPCPSIFMSHATAKKLKLKIKRPLVHASGRRIARGVDRYLLKAEEPFILSLTHQGGDRGEAVSQPWKTITGARRGEKALIMPLLAYQHQGGGARAADKPMRTICASTKDQNQVISCYVARQFGTGVGHAAASPMRTTMSKSTKDVFVGACLAVQTTGHSGGSVSEPLKTIAGAKHHNFIGAFLAQNNTGVIGHSAKSPFSTICNRGTNQSLIGVSLVKYYGKDGDPGVTKPLGAVRTKDCHGVAECSLAIPELTPELAVMARRVAKFLRSHGVVFEGEFATVCGLVIYDIGMRMFEPRELFLAQGFPRNYVIDRGRDELGNLVKLTKTAQIRMCGNSVPPAFATAICRANCPDLRLAT